MNVYVRKIKAKEGINSLDLEKIKKEIPAEYKASNGAPTITYTANHVVVSFDLQAAKNAPANAKGKNKAKGK